MHVVIFAGGTLRPGQQVQETIANSDLVIAADQGAATALQYGCTPAFVVGDFDSLPALPLQQLQARGSHIIRAAVEKNETDSELAIQLAIEQGATTITLLGGLGGARFDHTMGNIMLLAGFEQIPIRIVDGPSTCWLLRGPGHTNILGEKGDLLSLLPLTGDVTGVQTQGLYYPLHRETLYFGKPRGVSNVLTEQQAEVSCEQGLLLLIHTAIHELKEA
jgi:thiamine pyrophosphokinase